MKEVRISAEDYKSINEIYTIRSMYFKKLDIHHKM